MTNETTVVSSTAEAARLTGIKRDTIRDYLDFGTWKGTKRGRIWVEIHIPHSALRQEAVRATAPPPPLPSNDYEELITLRERCVRQQDEIGHLYSEIDHQRSEIARLHEHLERAQQIIAEFSKTTSPLPSLQH